MYVSSSDPLPRNSQDPPTPAENEFRKACLAADARAIARGRQAAYSTLMSLQNLYDVAPQIAVDGQKILQQTADSRWSSFFSGAPSQRFQSSRVIDASAEVVPENIPMNGTRGQIEGCTKIPAPQKERPLPARPVMPLPAPILSDVGVIAPPVVESPEAPKFSNLCFALRNGLFNTGGSGMISPDQLAALQYRCTQLGYAGACPTPPRTAAWLRQQAAKGALPKIVADQTVLDAIPQAPPLAGVPCEESYRMGGMSGYAPPWSDAWSGRSGSSAASTTGARMGILGWIRSNPWLALGIAGAGAVLMSQSSRGRR
jgi:hypothetical protein